MDQDLVFDTTIAGQVVRKHGRAWLVGGAVLFIGLYAYQLAFLPQTFTETVSVALQEPGAAVATASPLAALAGASTSKRYMGVLKSRSLAEEVENQVGLQRILRLPSREAAVNTIRDAIVPRDDISSGLLYIDVTLRGPAFLRGNATQRAKIDRAASDTANATSRALRRYYVESDNDRDTVLLRGADMEVRRARSEFEETAASLRNFVRKLGKTAPGVRGGVNLSEASGGMEGGDGPSGGPGGGGGGQDRTSELPALYTNLANADTSLIGAEVARATRIERVAEQLHDLTKVPTEDPLLADARQRVQLAQLELNNASILYGPDHVRVVTAKVKLANARKLLQQQTEGVVKRRTSDDATEDSELAGLRAKRDEIRKRIEESEQHMQASRELTVQYSDLRNELALRLEALKTTVTEAARLRLSTASAQSRVSVLDAAKPTDLPRPGIFRMAGVSLVAVIFAVLSHGALLYRSAVLRTARSTRQSA